MSFPPGTSRAGGSGGDWAARTRIPGEAGTEGPEGSGGDGMARTRGAAAPAPSPNRSPSNAPGGAVRIRGAAAPASGGEGGR